MRTHISKSATTLLGALTFAASSLLLASCGASAAPTAAPTLAPIVADAGGVVAEGSLTPNQAVDLAFTTPGEVAEVLVAEGDAVKKGDVLIRLGNQESLEAAIAGAEQELVNAKRGLSDLYDQAPTLQADTLKQVSEIEKQVRDAQYDLDNFTVATNQEDMTPMQGVQTMKDALDKARAAFEPVKFRPSGDSTRKARKEDLDNAQADYNSAVRRLQLSVTLSTAQARLSKAMSDLAALENGPKEEDLTLAQARINAAEKSLASAQAALDNLELTAPLDGIVVTVNPIVGEEVAPNQPVISLADFSQWFVETDDLTEIEVVDIEIGQEVTIVADALPDVELKGVVDSIAKKFEEKRGDVTYTVKIKLNEVDPRLRWGMTVAVRFGTK